MVLRSTAGWVTAGLVATAALAASLTLGQTSCNQTPTNVPVRTFERAGRMDVLCVQVMSSQPGDAGSNFTIPAIPVTLDHCAPVATGVDPTTLEFHTLAVVTQTARGELAVVDLTLGKVRSTRASACPASTSCPSDRIRRTWSSPPTRKPCSSRRRRRTSPRSTPSPRPTSSATPRTSTSRPRQQSRWRSPLGPPARCRKRPAAWCSSRRVPFPSTPMPAMPATSLDGGDGKVVVSAAGLRDRRRSCQVTAPTRRRPRRSHRHGCVHERIHRSRGLADPVPRSSRSSNLAEEQERPADERGRQGPHGLSGLPYARRGASTSSPTRQTVPSSPFGRVPRSSMTRAPSRPARPAVAPLQPVACRAVKCTVPALPRTVSSSGSCATRPVPFSSTSSTHARQAR